MKISIIEVEATPEDLKANITVADAMAGALKTFFLKLGMSAEQVQTEEDDEDGDT